MDSDGSEPDGKKVLTVWDHGPGFHIDTLLADESVDPFYWGALMAHVAIHLSRVGEAHGLQRTADDGTVEGVTSEIYLEVLREGFDSVLSSPPSHVIQ